MHLGTSSDKKTMRQRTEIEKKLMRPCAWCLATKLEIRGTKHVNFELRSPRPVMSKRRRFFVKMPVTELKAYSIRYVVGNGRSACWATTAYLLYVALTWESNHIVSFLTAWIGFMPSSICNSINSSTWSGPWPNTPCFHSQTGMAGLSTQEESSVSSVELLRQLGKVFGNDSQGFVGRFTLAEGRELANVTSRNLWAPEGQFRDESTNFDLAVNQKFAQPGVPCLVSSICQKHLLSNKSMLSCHWISNSETLLCHFQIQTPCRRVPQTSQDSFLWITIAPECRTGLT